MSLCDNPGSLNSIGWMLMLGLSKSRIGYCTEGHFGSCINSEDRLQQSVDDKKVAVNFMLQLYDFYLCVFYDYVH